ncbi:hypothetical protein DPMN_032346 [Dreissena polymorpha]|uniref:Uncharacterized protein n=1 Tax=Dreissena polymorpha TaxID=45954 RepID=A0A9D4M3K9_DREPO|nr:hypothetical protein DPMN_032346 [Dreissena polymorpha]
MAFETLVCKPATVFTTNEHNIEVKPYESISFSGSVRGLSHTIQKVVTENRSDDGSLIVSPHVVKLPQHAQSCTSKLPVSHRQSFHSCRKSCGFTSLPRIKF